MTMKINCLLGKTIGKHEMKSIKGGQNGWGVRYYCLSDPSRTLYAACPSPTVCPAGCGKIYAFSTTTSPS